MNLMNPLFACLRAPRPTSAVVDIAREFSPRLQRQGPGCVVCDVSGLGSLLGDPASIGAEIARSAAVSGSAVRVAVAPTMTAALLLTLAHDLLTVVEADVASALSGLSLVHLQQLVAETEGTPRRRPASPARRTARMRRASGTSVRSTWRGAGGSRPSARWPC